MFWLFMHEWCGSWVTNWVTLYAWDGNVWDSWVLTWCEYDVRMGWFMTLKWWVSWGIWHGVGMKSTYTFVLWEGWMKWIQHGIQMRMDGKVRHEIFICAY